MKLLKKMIAISTGLVFTSLFGLAQADAGHLVIPYEKFYDDTLFISDNGRDYLTFGFQPYIDEDTTGFNGWGG